MSDPDLRVVVAGVPRSLHEPRPDGRWLTPAHLEQLRRVAPDAQLIHTTRDELDAGPGPQPGADVLLLEAGDDAWYREEIPRPGFAKLITPRLRWIQSCSSGVGHLLATGLVPEHVLLTNAAGVHADALGESVMGAILFHAKRVGERLHNQRDRAWQPLKCQELTGQHLCVLGTGHIGAAVASRARCFGMRVTGVRRSPRDTPPFHRVVGTGELTGVLADCDYLVIACPLTDETHGLVGARAFAALKPGAYLINVSRGLVVDEEALLASLDAGRLAGAFLDAHSEEPLPDVHPYWSTPGITLIPHDSHSSPRTGDNIVDLFVDNLARFRAGEALRNRVDPALGY